MAVWNTCRSDEMIFYGIEVVFKIDLANFEHVWILFPKHSSTKLPIRVNAVLGKPREISYIIQLANL